MTPHIRGYLDQMGKQLHLYPQERQEILNEFEAHIEDRVNELIENGLPRDAALNEALRALGKSDLIAGQLYEVHSRVSWYHTALATLPHLLLSLVFALRLWTAPVWVISMLVLALTITIIGWRKGRPRWTYPWLGYCLVTPIVSWGLAMSAVGYGAWGVVANGALPLSIPIYAASFIYISFSVWIVIRIVRVIAKPDWLMGSLAVLPIPFLGFWFFYFYNGGDLLQSDVSVLKEVDTSVAIVFLIIGLATAAFFRISRRVARVALLAITAPSLIVLAWISYQGGAGFIAVFLFAVMSLAVLLIPAFFDLKNSEPEVNRYAADENAEGTWG
ncbi:MAG: hypothetical protein J4O08_02710 [Chloroflexi bacterium]|nr:hypothetical protein [Chloroflexota bacterium]MCI0868603.1 hypothetical protein [Chloroflexota bacterium]